MTKDFLDHPVFSWITATLIIYSVVCFSVETIPGLSAGTMAFLQWSEIVVVAIFTAEYLYRLWLAEKKLGYIFSFYGMIDLLAILPFYLATSLDLRSLRMLRLLRLAVLLKVVRHDSTLQRFSKALAEAKGELAVFGLASLMLLYLAAVGIYYFENEAQPEVFASIFDSLWWAVTTFTTVGYGDTYPITLGGRIFTFFILMIGLGFISVPAGIVAAALSATRRKEEREEQ